MPGHVIKARVKIACWKMSSRLSYRVSDSDRRICKSLASVHALHDNSLHTSRVSPVILSQKTILHNVLPKRAWYPVVGRLSLCTRLAVAEGFSARG
jgi:hypothetical protein